MSGQTVKYLLQERDIPTHWVNLLPDLPGDPSRRFIPGPFSPSAPTTSRRSSR